MTASAVVKTTGSGKTSTEPMSLKGYVPGTRSRILLIGDSGSGKTQFAGTMPKPFFADFDRGLATLAGHETAVAKDFAKEGWGAFADEVQRWRKDGPQYGCETFVLDSLTTAADALMDSILARKGKLGAQPDIADWGEAIRGIKELMGYLTTLDCHVIVTAHLSVEKDELTGALVRLPLIYGKELPHKLPLYFDEVWCTNVQIKLSGGAPVPEYRLQVVPDNQVKIVKSRLNRQRKLAAQEEPNFEKLVIKAAK